ncbi:MAG: hypothetical protein K2R93_14890 [Gemmatimonadaceae bacterium]|nr:hypothetical protein [Gemmatimonadaceae bacterium]
MWNELCDEAHEAHAMQVIHRAVLVIATVFLSFGGYAIATRLGADHPPTSVAYGTKAPAADVVVIGD